MAGQENLIPFNERTEEEQRAIRIKGGIASGESRRKRKALREYAETLMTLPVSSEKSKEQLRKMGIDDKDIDNQMLLVAATFNKAIKGDAKAINIMREMLGERVQEIKVNTSVDEKVKELGEILEDI